MRRKLMDTVYARIKDHIVLAIERSLFATYAEINFSKAHSSGLLQKKHIHLYNQLLTEFKFDFMYGDESLSLYVQTDKPSSIPNFIKDTIGDYIVRIERWCV